MSYIKISKNLYEITIEAGFDVTGKRKRIKRRIHGTKEEIELKHAELMKKYYHKGKTLNLNDMTFEEYSNIFIKNYCEVNVSKVTLKDYQQMLNRILPLLGSTKLKKVSTFMLDKMYQKIKSGQKGKELSPKTMSHYYNLMSLMFKQAKKWKFIDSNPNEDATKPKLLKKQRNFYDSEQVAELLKCLSNENLKTKTIITLALDSGMRRSELCALRWGDIDFTNNTIYIDNSLKVVHGVVDEDRAKTEYSVRTIMLSSSTMRLLAEYKEAQNEYIVTMGNKWVGTDRVFTARDGKHMHPDTTNKLLQKFLTKYNLPKLSFHELRHTCASVLNSNGIDPKTISERLGHSDISVTMNIYTHSFSDNKKASASVFDNLQKIVLE